MLGCKTFFQKITVPEQVVPATPDGSVSSGHSSQLAEALTPTGNPQLSPLCLDMAKASLYVGCVQSAFAEAAIVEANVKSFFSFSKKITKNMKKSKIKKI